MYKPGLFHNVVEVLSNSTSLNILLWGGLAETGANSFLLLIYSSVHSFIQCSLGEVDRVSIQGAYGVKQEKRHATKNRVWMRKLWHREVK